MCDCVYTLEKSECSWDEQYQHYLSCVPNFCCIYKQAFLSFIIKPYEIIVANSIYNDVASFNDVFYKQLEGNRFLLLALMFSKNKYTTSNRHPSLLNS